MEIGEIIGDAIRYPLNHSKSLLIYIVISFIIGLIGAFTGVSLIAGQETNHILTGGALAFVGLILMILISLLLEGYGLDIIKFGIQRSEDAPEIEFVSQIIKGLKYLIIGFIYCIIPLIIMAILSAINDTLGAIVGIILFIIFGFALLMGECRLAKTDSLGEALNIPEALKDAKNIGIIKILLVLIIIIIIAIILSMIAGITQNLGTIGLIISAILSAIVTAYTFFFANRALGLLYSEV